MLWFRGIGATAEILAIVERKRRRSVRTLDLNPQYVAALRELGFDRSILPNGTLRNLRQPSRFEHADAR